MLVLSRKPNERIVFPAINTSVQIVSIKSGVVRVGIDAPHNVAVFREELLPAEGITALALPRNLRELRHAIRNRLNAGGIGLALLRRQIENGRYDECEATLRTLEREFHAMQEKVAELTTPPKPAAQPPARSRKALVVEDDTNERELLAGFLRMAGLDVVTAGDGADALDYLRTEGRPDIVLLDLMLPHTDGITTAKEIRRDPANEGLKIFAVTGHSADRFGPDGLRGAGIDRWFQKPLNPEALLRDLNQDLNQPA
jgi:carbon storage regulator CsrA